MVHCKQNKQKNQSLKTLNDSINIGYIFCKSIETNFATLIPNLIAYYNSSEVKDELS